MVTMGCLWTEEMNHYISKTRPRPGFAYLIPYAQAAVLARIFFKALACNFISV